jgi:ssDNA-binding Zn-finger/Zn-ribbon topoisomerase 1
MIDQFTLEDFEQFLEAHKPYEALGLVDGEHCYKLILDGQSAIMLRSSIGANGLAKESGKDSIRLWLMGNDEKPLGSKLDSWTTRVSGWQRRLFDKIYKLTERRLMAGDCKDCGKPFGIYKRKADKKLFVKCFPCSKRLKKNVNGNLLSEGWFSAVSHYEEATINAATLSPNNVALDEFLANPFAEDEPEKPKSNIPTCPKCDSKMILRSGPHFDDFWGCANYPKCKGTVSIPQQKVKLPYFPPSKHQSAIYDFVKDNNEQHGRVDGVAGCGKTYTNVTALNLVPKSAKTKYVTFGNRNQKDIARKAPDHVSVTTFHVMGQANIYNALPKAKRDKWKVHNIADDVLKNSDKELKGSVVKLVGLLKGAMLEPTRFNILDLACDFDVEIEVEQTDIVRQIFKQSVRDKTTFDFNDMIYWPAAGIVPAEKFDYIFIDEFQDMDMAQYVMSKKSLRNSGRMLAIGDPWQSIFKFRGAHSGIMDFMSDDLNATRLSLPISYRAPLAVVKHVNEHYPHIHFEGAEGAKNGHVGWINEDDFFNKIDQKSAVLCRTNAPLIEPCFSLIRRGIKATILGRDIGAGLIKLIEKREKMKRVHNLDDLLEQVSIYCLNETRKAIKRKQESRVALLLDQEETLYALSAECESVQDLKEKTKATFSDQEEDVTFSSIHKAKGLEWIQVFIIGSKGNHPMGDKAQEMNIRYVRDTRTLDKLYFVED